MRTATRARSGTVRVIAVAASLYLVALLVRLFAATQIDFAATEPSAYYVAVAQNLVEGRGLVTDALWSFATPPLELPRPAFELWLPMSSLVSAMAMGLLGSSFWSAQVGGALLGALVAPLTWAVARQAARVAGLDDRRGSSVAIASGLLAAILAPFVLPSVVPDSYTPFLVFILIAALLVPRAVGDRDETTVADSDASHVAWGLGLGLALGLSYLSRQEVIWLGLTVLLMVGWVARGRPAGQRLRAGAARLWPIVAGGLIVVVPWLLRDAAEFGSPFPGQAIENMVFVRNEDVFAFAERPSLDRYLSQGLAAVLGNPLFAAWLGFTEVLLLPAFPVGLAGIAALPGLRRSAALHRPTALLALLASGGLTFLATALLFPVATRWGTFLHASGPLLVGLIVTAAMGADAVVARLSELRRWPRPNIIIGPIALVAVSVLLGYFQLSLLAGQASTQQARFKELAAGLIDIAEAAGEAIPTTVITDHPMWLADAIERQTVALPDEELGSIMALSGAFEAPWLVVVDARGRYPAALLDDSADACLAGPPVRIGAQDASAWLFRLAEPCAEP